MIRIQHGFQVNTSLNQVHQAVSTAFGILPWWFPKVKPEPDKNLTIYFGPTNFKHLKLTKNNSLIVQWHCVEANREWIDTGFIYELEKKQLRRKSSCLNMLNGTIIPSCTAVVITIGCYSSEACACIAKPNRGSLFQCIMMNNIIL